MENEKKTEIYSFSHTTDYGVTTNLDFFVPAEPGVHISTFHDMCKRFAYALGYAEKTIEEWFGESGESFAEYME